MNNKFKNCFINNIPNYEYEITWLGLYFGKCRLMSQYAKAELIKRNILKTLDLNGNIKTNLKTSLQLMMIDYIYAALYLWDVDMLLTRNNISLMKLAVLVLLFMQIQKNELNSITLVEQNEKN